MAPQPNLDFASIMADLSQFQAAVGKIHAQLTNPRQREVLGEALDNIANARADVEATYPKTIRLIEDDARRTLQEAETTRAEVQQKRQQIEQALQQAAQGRQLAGQAAASIPAAPSKPAVELHPAEQLREELLARFTPNDPAAPATPILVDREIWQDWGQTQPAD